MEFLIKIVIDFKLQTIFAKRSILAVLQVLSLLTKINQTLFTNNKRATSRFFGTVTVTAKPVTVESQQEKH